MENDDRKWQRNDEDEQNEPDDWYQSIVKEEKLMEERRVKLETKLDTYEGLNAATNLEVKTLKTESNAINATFKEIHDLHQKAASHQVNFIKGVKEFYPNTEDVNAQLNVFKQGLSASECVIKQNTENVDALIKQLEKKNRVGNKMIFEFDDAQFEREMKEATKKNEEDEKTLSEFKCKLDSMIASGNEQYDIKEQLGKDMEVMNDEIKAVEEELLVASHTLDDIKAETAGIEESQKAVDEAENRIQKLTYEHDEKQKIINELKEKLKHDQMVNNDFEQTIGERQDKLVAYENEAKSYQLQAVEIEKNGLEELAQSASKIADLENKIKTQMESIALLTQEQCEIDALIAKQTAENSDLEKSLFPEGQEEETDVEKEIELVVERTECEKNLLQDAQKELDASVAKYNQTKAEVEADVKAQTVAFKAAKKLYEDNKELDIILDDEIKALSGKIEKSKLELVILRRDETQLLGKATQKALMDQHPQAPPKKVAKKWDSDSTDDVGSLARFGPVNRKA